MVRKGNKERKFHKEYKSAPLLCCCWTMWHERVQRGWSRPADGAGEVDPECLKYGKAAVQRGVGATGTEPEEAHRVGVVCALCATAEFIALGCLGNVSGFKNQLNKCAEDGHWYS